MPSAMRSKADIILALTNPGIIAVVRAKRAEQVIPLAEALIAGGVIAIEITMTTPDAIACIREADRKLGQRALIGVGTVIDSDTCRAAIAAGAQFVVSPICRTELVCIAREAQRPVMLGAYTPTEAQLAHEAGADFVKLFPADILGPGYIKALRAPLPHLRIVPTGGERNAPTNYTIPNNRVTVHWMQGSVLRASAMRGLGAPQISKGRLGQFACPKQGPDLTLRLIHARDGRGGDVTIVRQQGRYHVD